MTVMCLKEGLLIRTPQRAEAGALCDLLRRSIAALCVQDHHNDPRYLDRWLANKKPETLAAWIADDGGEMLVAERGGALCAVGWVLRSGEIALNYVAPEARFSGVSKAMIAALEARAALWGLLELRLDSTGTAKQFYLSAGYICGDEKTGLFGTLVYPMTKRLRAPDSTGDKG